MLLTRFLHFLGLSLWIGGMVSAMVLSSNAKAETGRVRDAALQWMGRIYSLVVGPGAVLTVVTGLALTMSLAQRMGSEVMARPGIWIMQAAGLLAGVLVLFVGLPSATGLARMAAAAGDADLPHSFGRIQRRLAVVVHLVALLVILSLFVVVVVR